MAWTEEQLAAMEKNSGNLLVAAGAGSGKTAVLIARIMGIITDTAQPVDIDSLLVLTYTNAAAAEMRQRLAAALRERLLAQPEDAHLNRQLVLVQRAKIMTIHAFCLDLLREYGYALELDPKSHIGSEGELNLLRERVLEEVFEAGYAQPDSGLRLLLQNYSRGLGDDNIKALVLRLVNYGQSMPDITGWLAGLSQVYQEGDASAWLAYFGECLQVELEELQAISGSAAALAEEAGLAGYAAVLQTDQAALARVVRPLAGGKLLAALHLLAGLEFKRLPPVKAKENVDLVAKERVQLLRKQVKDKVASLLREAAPLLRDNLAVEMQEQAPLAQALTELTAAYYQAWQQAKRQRRLLEFADLEHYALALLQNEELGVAASLRQRFFEILVDEYQDINEVQESLLELLSNGNNRFMVGDIKQSIYRFRLAEPRLFLRRFAAYGQGQGGRRVDLNRNFRSQGAVLAGVNFVFSQLMQGGNLEIVYDEAALLRCGRPELPQEPVELLIIDKEAVRSTAASAISREAEEADDEAEEGNALTSWLADMQAAELEANLLALKIRQEQARGYAWGDMVILLRAVRGWAPIISQILRAQAIPCRAEGFDNFLTLPEVQVVYNLLAVLDNPRQDIPLAAVLHSPLVGLGLAELADLHILSKNSLYEGMQLSHDGRLLAFAQRLTDWRQRSLELSTADLLEYIYNAAALPELLGALPGQTLRRRSLRELQRLAGDYDAAGGVGLGRFLKFLAAGGQTAGQAETEEADAVRLMTIHKSKGLEFPVVFVAGLGSTFNEEDFRRDILLHRTLGLGMRRVDLTGRRKYPTFGFNIIMRKTRWESLAEALRLLYVAMTRAEHKLYLIGTTTSSVRLGQLLGSLPDDSPLGGGFLARNRSFLPWLGAALLRHPQGGVLRQLAGWAGPVERGLPGAEGGWRVELVSQLPQVQQQAAQMQKPFSLSGWLAEGAAAPGGEEQAAAIRQALARQYPGAELSRLPIKWSATSFKQLAPLPEPADDDPQPQLDLSLTAEEFAEDLAAAGGRSLEWYAAYGRLVHGVLQRADLAVLRDCLNRGEPEGISRHLQEVLQGLAAGVADPSLAAAVRPQQLARFFSGGLGQRLLGLPEQAAVMREQRFIMRLNLAELAGLEEATARRLAAACGLTAADWSGLAAEGLFVQGVIDLAFATTAGWVLVDYKSGSSRNKSAEQVREQYGLQLALYRQALKGATGQPVSEGYVYFTASGRSVRLF